MRYGVNYGAMYCYGQYLFEDEKQSQANSKHWPLTVTVFGNYLENGIEINNAHSGFLLERPPTYLVVGSIRDFTVEPTKYVRLCTRELTQV